MRKTSRSAKQAKPQVGQHPQHLRRQVTRTVDWQYLLHLPAAYRPSGPRWPVMLFLHGGGEIGSDLEKVKIHGPPKHAAVDPTFPFILIAPQCPHNTPGWAYDDLIVLLDDVLRKYHADPDRVYLTGMSFGGYGTWELATRYPERFAAIVPICGKGDLWRVGRLKDMPIWAIHGAKDAAVPVEGTTETVAAIRRAGGQPRVTIYANGTHDVWTRTYKSPAVYEWMLKHKRGARGS